MRPCIFRKMFLRGLFYQKTRKFSSDSDGDRSRYPSIRGRIRYQLSHEAVCTCRDLFGRSISSKHKKISRAKYFSNEIYRFSVFTLHKSTRGSNWITLNSIPRSVTLASNAYKHYLMNTTNLKRNNFNRFIWSSGYDTGIAIGRSWVRIPSTVTFFFSLKFHGSQIFLWVYDQKIRLCIINQKTRKNFVRFRMRIEPETFGTADGRANN